MIRHWRVTLHVGSTICTTSVKARSHTEAYDQAIQILNLKEALVRSATITPTLERP